MCEFMNSTMYIVFPFPLERFVYIFTKFNSIHLNRIDLFFMIDLV